MGFIKKILAGVLAFLQGLFGGIGKALGLGKSEYFLELSDTEAGRTSESDTPSADFNGGSPATTDKASAPAASAAPSASLATPGSPVAKPTPGIVTSSTDPAQSIQSPAQPRTDKPSASTVLTPSPASHADTGNGKSDDSGMTFATDFLLDRSAIGKGRRRPGPSLNPFKEMARDIGGAS